MDILKRALAPLTEAAWTAIDERARQMLEANLSARRVVDVVGPKGWEFPSVPLGRLEFPKKQPMPGVRMGLHKVLPLIEVRVPFEVDTAELDNLARGAQDIDLSGLDAAAKLLAEFEEKAVYYGLASAGIRGLKEASAYKPLATSKDPEDILEKITTGLTQMRANSVQGPYALVVNPRMWVALSGHIKGFPLSTYLETVMGGQVIVSPYVTDAFLITTRGGDFALTVGQDIAIGCEAHDLTKAMLFFIETFTFMVIEPAAVMVLSEVA